MGYLDALRRMRISLISLLESDDEYRDNSDFWKARGVVFEGNASHAQIPKRSGEPARIEHADAVSASGAVGSPGALVPEVRAGASPGRRAAPPNTSHPRSVGP